MTAKELRAMNDLAWHEQMEGRGLRTRTKQAMKMQMMARAKRRKRVQESEQCVYMCVTSYQCPCLSSSPLVLIHASPPTYACTFHHTRDTKINKIILF